MSRGTLLILAVVLAFAALVVLASTRSEPGPGAGPAREAASDACQSAIRQRIPDARFPFPARYESIGENRVRISGTVDSGDAASGTRSNYICLMRRTGPNAPFVADSVDLWQSH
jgi:hypothetical protein